MRARPILKFLGLALLVALTATAQQDGTDPSSRVEHSDLPEGDLGLLGQAYASLTYSYIKLDALSTHGDGYAFEMNHPLAFGVDGVLGYTFSRPGVIAGIRTKQRFLTTALRAFSTSYNWGKPYVEAGGGYVWSRRSNTKDSSYTWQVAAGAEFQLIARATLTPYVQYADAPDLIREGVWNVGVKGNYWIDSAWALTTGVARDDEQNTAIMVGTNFRY